MTLANSDLVQETTSTTGTGTLTLSGAVAGYQSFAIVGTGNTTYYCIRSGTNKEVGIGTYTASGTTLSRDTVLYSSAGGTTKITVAAGATVINTYPAETSVSGGGGGTYPTIQPTLNLDFANTKLLDPRITFVRNSTAAYYDGQTTAMAEQNLLLQSQTFATTWVTSNTTLGSVTTAPDGTTTAYPLTASAINGTLLQTFTATATAYTFSIYIQRVTGTGNIDITVDGTTYATQTTSGTWTRFTITTTPAAGSKTVGIRLAVSGDVVNIWGAQLEQRSSVTAYTPTTTAAITNYIPQLMTAAAGVARFDCDPITSKSLGLLIEEGRTNLLTYSSDFSNAAWSKTGTTATSVANVAPDGTLTVVKVIEGSSTGSHYINQSIGVTNATAYTYTFYVKAGERTKALFYVGNVGNGLTIDLTNGTVVGGSGTVSSLSVGNGWYRISYIFTATSTASSTFQVWVLNAAGSLSYTGDGYSGIYIWGAQLEAGAFATSYIPTVASTVTRAADQDTQAIQVNVYTGSIKLEFIPNHGVSSLGCPLWSSYIDASNYSAIFHDGTNMLFRKRIAGTNYDASIALTYVAAQLIKVAVSWSNVNINIAVNGLLGTANANTLPLQLSSIQRIGALEFLKQANNVDEVRVDGGVKNIAYYPIVLSTSNLVALTS